MSRRYLTQEELEKALLESDDSETEDVIIREESETESESGDSDGDPEWLPNEEMESQVLGKLSKICKEKDLDINQPHSSKRLKRTEETESASGSLDVSDGNTASIQVCYTILHVGKS